MVKALVVFLFAAFASSLAHGAAYVSIVPATPGPYVPGQSLELTVDLFQDPGSEDRLLRLIQLDFNHSDPAIGLEHFAFDFPTIPPSNLYVLFPGFPWPATAYTGTFPNPMGQLNLPGDGTPLHIGHMTITVPWEPGPYVIDAVTPKDADNPDDGGFLQYGFGLTPDDPRNERWDLLNASPVSEVDDLNGLGRVFKFSVIPEPATAILLGVAGAGLFFRRRPRRRASPA